ncbi:MAG TPA: hypothetical protein VFV19_10870 [Candidatus Polarisedimenticolaceae bacterium]|nr:hypothetical protein [Candidatus Polarisedimenticolaceae bacterium]
MRVRLLDIPLERDEGEYAYAGQLLLQGVPPYAAVYSMKAPGIYGAYAAAMAVAGETPRGVHLGLLAANLVSMFGLFILGRRIAGPLAGAVAGAAYGLMALSASVLGFAAHATQFVVPFVVLGLLFLTGSRFVLAGVCFALACLMKQHAATFVVFAIVWLAVDRWRRLGLIRFLSGFASPIVIVWLALAVCGVFPRYWFWNVTYAFRYATSVPLAEGLGSLGAHLAAMWTLAGFAVLACFGVKHRFLAGLLAASFVAVVPGLYFRSHYFVQMLPAVALLAGAGAAAIEIRLGKAAATVALALPVALFVGVEAPYLFRASPDEVSHHFYPGGPFVESAAIANYLASHTEPGERIAVLGSEPQIYFLSGRRGVTAYVYMYGLMEPQPHALEMQHEVAAEVEAAAPRFIVWSNVRSSWLRERSSPTFIFAWAQDFLSDRYDKVQDVPIPPDGEVDRIEIFRKK